MPKTLQIKLTRSPIGFNKRQKATVKALGLRKLNQVVEKEDTPDVRGMITAVSHLVVVTESEKTEE
ncbi:MAG: 50S ribosomal protein L30 [Chloroflexi bacterium]|nr:MAG: 50S ribosomal protein L30 [Chloroflexota bacterium]